MSLEFRNQTYWISFGGIPISRNIVFVQVFLMRAANPGAGIMLLNLLSLTWPCNKHSQNLLRDLLPNLLRNPLHLTWLCTKASWNLLRNLLPNAFEIDLALYQSLPDFLRNLPNFVRNPAEPDLSPHQSLLGPSRILEPSRNHPRKPIEPNLALDQSLSHLLRNLCWTWPGSAPEPPRPSPKPSPKPFLNVTRLCTKASDTVSRSRRKRLHPLSKVTRTWTFCSSSNYQTLHHTTLSYTRYYATLSTAILTSTTTATAKIHTLSHTTSSNCEVPSATIAATPKTQLQPPFRPSRRFPLPATALCSITGHWLQTGRPHQADMFRQFLRPDFHMSLVPQEYLWCGTCMKRISVSEVSRCNRCSICNGVLGVFPAVLLCTEWYRFHSDIVFATDNWETIGDTDSGRVTKARETWARRDSIRP